MNEKAMDIVIESLTDTIKSLRVDLIILKGENARLKEENAKLKEWECKRNAELAKPVVAINENFSCV